MVIVALALRAVVVARGTATAAGVGGYTTSKHAGPATAAARGVRRQRRARAKSKAPESRSTGGGALLRP